MANSSQIQNTLYNFRLNEKLGNFLHIYQREALTRQDTDTRTYYTEKAKLKSYRYDYDSKAKFLLGYGTDNYRLARVNASVMSTDYVDDNNVFRNDPLMKLTYTYQERKRYSSNAVYRKFLSYVKRSVAWNNKELSDMMEDLYKAQKCKNNLVINYKAAFYEKAINTIVDMNKDEILSVLARFSNKEIINSADEEDWSLTEKGLLKFNNQNERWYKHIFKKFKRKKVIRKLIEIRKASTKEMKVKKLRNLMAKYKSDPFLVHFFAALLQEKLKNQEDMGMTLNVSLSSKECQLNWVVNQLPNYRPEDIMSSWNDNN